MYWFGASEMLGNVNVMPLSNRSPASGSVFVADVLDLDVLEIVVVAAGVAAADLVGRRGGRMVHHLRDADRRREIHVETGVGQGAPDSAGVDAGLDLDALGERDRTGVENGVRIQPAAGQTRIGAVERVVDRRRRGRDRQRVAGIEQAAVLGRAVDGVGGRVDAGIQSFAAQLLDQDVRPLRQPGVEHVIAAVRPVGGRDRACRSRRPSAPIRRRWPAGPRRPTPGSGPARRRRSARRR